MENQKQYCPKCHKPLTIKGRGKGTKRRCTNPDCTVMRVFSLGEFVETHHRKEGK